MNFWFGLDHKNESASPVYYRGFSGRYNINAELTTTCVCGHPIHLHKDGRNKKLVAISRQSNERVNGLGAIRPRLRMRSRLSGSGETVFFHTGRREIKKLRTSNLKMRGQIFPS